MQQGLLLNGVLQAVRSGIIVFDNDRRIVLWNRWMEQHSQFTAASMLGKHFVEAFPDMVNSRTHAAIESALENSFSSLLSQTLHQSPFPLYTTPSDAEAGLRMQQAVHVVPLEVPGMPRHCMVQITDVSMAVSRERKLREMATELESQTLVDGMTGIANRRRFDQHLEDEFRRAKRGNFPISLIMLDVDYFKSYNDNYGHQRGDFCLAQIAAALNACLNRSRDLVARYGGEEFGVILPDTNEEGAVRIAETMREKIGTLRLEHGYSKVAPHVTISLGVSTMRPGQGTQASALIDTADRALYQAKRAGRNCVSVYAWPSAT